MERELVVITGMSGAGRSTTAHALEDLRWYVVDNLPPAMLSGLADLSDRADGPQQIAAIMDVRAGGYFQDLDSALDELRRRNLNYRLVFLEASDEELVRRFESVRRPHPLQGEGRILDGITREREALRELRGEADLIIDTTGLNVHQLQEKVERVFAHSDQTGLRVTILSFGYKYGLPYDADLVVDARFIPNPHWVPELRPQTGLAKPVSDYVLEQLGTREFIDRYLDLFQVVAEGYQREGKKYVTLAVGCTGGKHRSVAVTEELARRLRDAGVEATAVHRDMGRE